MPDLGQRMDDRQPTALLSIGKPTVGVAPEVDPAHVAEAVGVTFLASAFFPVSLLLSLAPMQPPGDPGGSGLVRSGPQPWVV